MKLVKSLLLGSAAGLCAVAGAQAADLPVKKAVAVEYVRVCTAHGAGFFYIPGTDTCLRVGGRARFEYQYTSSRSYAGSVVGGDNSGYRGLGRLNIDARTGTPYGTLRAFVRFEIMSATGGYIRSGTQERFGTAFGALGQDTFGRSQTGVNIDKAFIQFAGITAGRASSFFDFYAHDLEFLGGTSGSDVASTNLLAYTATFGNGFSATLSMEDPTFRRQPILATRSASTGSIFSVPTNLFAGETPVAVVTTFGPTGGVLGTANLDVAQRNRVPDVVGALRLDDAWGSAQISAAMHEINVGRYSGAAVAAGAPAGTVVGQITPQIPSAEYGFGVQGGLKFNLPQIAKGDVLWLQAAYSEGALSYAGQPFRLNGSEATTDPLSGRFSVSTDDAALTQDGQIKLTQAASFTAAFLHYWTPEWRSAIFGSYANVNFADSLRSGDPRVGNAFLNSMTVAGRTFSPVLMDYDVAVVGTNLIWSPVRDLDIGVEALYSQVNVKNRVIDANLNPGGAAGAPVRTTRSDDVFMTRLRIQRDF
jgi:hypothetical protein